MLRRIRKEISEEGSWNWSSFIEEDKITIYVPVKLCGFYQTLVEKNDLINGEPLLIFNITRLYPFTAPEVYYLTCNIKDIYKVHLQNELDEMIEQHYTKNNKCLLCNNTKNCKKPCSCMCCSTIICKNNWVPFLKIKNIIEEFTRFIDIKKRLVERFHCKKIQTKYLHQIPIKYLPIHNYL